MYKKDTYKEWCETCKYTPENRVYETLNNIELQGCAYVENEVVRMLEKHLNVQHLGEMLMALSYRKWEAFKDNDLDRCRMYSRLIERCKTICTTYSGNEWKYLFERICICKRLKNEQEDVCITMLGYEGDEEVLVEICDYDDHGNFTRRQGYVAVPAKQLITTPDTILSFPQTELRVYFGDRAYAKQLENEYGFSDLTTGYTIKRVITREEMENKIAQLNVEILEKENEIAELKGRIRIFKEWTD